MDTLERAKHLQQLSLQGKTDEALNTYYAEDVVVVEANGDTFTGRETQRQRIAEWNQSVEELHDGGIRSLCVNADGTVATIETYYEMTWQGGMRGTMEEVAVQQWKDGRVVHERFYYWVPAEMQNPEPLSGDNA